MADDRLPPSSSETEQCFLGSLLISCQPPYDNDIVWRALAEDGDAIFYEERHKAIHRTAAEYFTANAALDEVLLLGALRANGRLDDIGGVAYLAEILEAVPSPANFEIYLRELKRLAVEREIYFGGIELAQNGENEENFKVFKERIERAIYRLRPPACASFKDVINGVADRLDAVQEDTAPPLISTGYLDLDRLMGGWQKSEYTILGGRSSHGKTTFMLNLAWRVVERGHKIFIASYEMSAARITAALANIAGAINIRGAIRHRERLDELDYAKAVNAFGLLREIEKQIILYDFSRQGNSIINLEAAIIAAFNAGAEFVFIDYLQLIRPSKDALAKKNREQEVADMSGRLNMLCHGSDASFIVLSQINKDAEKTKNPRMSNLRESDAIGNDCDNGILLWSPEKGCENLSIEDREELKNAVEVKVEKQREGTTGSFWMTFRRDVARFEDMPFQEQRRIEALRNGKSAEKKEGHHRRDIYAD